MNRIVGLFALSVMFAAGAYAQATDGFSVGGVGTFGGSAVNPVTENGWDSLDDYREARDHGYTNSAGDAQLWADAGEADSGSNARINGATCPEAGYDDLRTGCGAQNCQDQARSVVLPLRDFHQGNDCISPGYATLADYNAASAYGYGMNDVDSQLWSETDNATLDPFCSGGDCSLVSPSSFSAAKTEYATFAAAGWASVTAYRDATDLGYGNNAGDAAIWAETDNATYAPYCANNDCSSVTKSAFLVAKSTYEETQSAAGQIASKLASDNESVSASDIASLLQSESATADSDLDLDNNPIHVAYVEACMNGKTGSAALAACATTVDGVDLNKYVVTQVISGAQAGTVTPAVLQGAGVSGPIASVAAGNTCGPQENQSCFGFISSTLGTKAGITTSTIQNALLTYFDGAVTSSDTDLPVSTLTTGCSGAAATYQVPNPPPICASVNWNCSSNTAGISVVYNDQGKGNIQADSNVFTGNSYTVTATLDIGGATRTRTINGSFNVQQAIAGAANGYKTGWQPAWWRGYDVIGRAKSTCNAWGGSITTYAEIEAANSQYNLIPNGTRTIFADANGNADRSTSGRSQCSESWPQGPHSLRWYNSVLSQTCKGKAGFGRNFTFLCKDVPSC